MREIERSRSDEPAGALLQRRQTTCPNAPETRPRPPTCKPLSQEAQAAAVWAPNLRQRQDRGSGAPAAPPFIPHRQEPRRRFLEQRLMQQALLHRPRPTEDEERRLHAHGAMAAPCTAAACRRRALLPAGAPDPGGRRRQTPPGPEHHARLAAGCGRVREGGQRAAAARGGSTTPTRQGPRRRRAARRECVHWCILCWFGAAAAAAARRRACCARTCTCAKAGTPRSRRRDRRLRCPQRE